MLSLLWLFATQQHSPSDSSVHGISQAQTLEWIAISSSRGSLWLWNWTWFSRVAGRLFTTEPTGKPLFFFLFFFFSFIFISWRLITLQYCSGFCHTLTWISHGVTCIPHPNPLSHLLLHQIPLGLGKPLVMTKIIRINWQLETVRSPYLSHWSVNSLLLFFFFPNFPQFIYLFKRVCVCVCARAHTHVHIASYIQLLWPHGL